RSRDLRGPLRGAGGGPRRRQRARARHRYHGGALPCAGRRGGDHHVSPRALVAVVCAAQVCAQIGAYTWPALLPRFLGDWGLTNSEAGWITALFYASYTVSVPILVTLTDRIDPRTVYLTGVGLTVLSHGGFALFVDGPWGAAAARAIAGVGWAGT